MALFGAVFFSEKVCEPELGAPVFLENAFCQNQFLTCLECYSFVDRLVKKYRKEKDLEESFDK